MTATQLDLEFLLPVKILPSLLSAPFNRLGAAIHELETAGADLFHYDVMDGHFVPNLTIGPLVIQSLSPHIHSRFDAHLMVSNPEVQIAWFNLPMVRSITIHVEASRNVHQDLDRIRQINKKAGISLNPATPIQSLESILDQVDQILVMSVHPGFAGQKFMPEILPKIEYLAQRKQQTGAGYIIQVDGGINRETIRRVRSVGAEEIVAGNAIFNQPNPAEALEQLYRLAENQ